MFRSSSLGLASTRLSSTTFAELGEAVNTENLRETSERRCLRILLFFKHFLPNLIRFPYSLTTTGKLNLVGRTR